LSWIKLYHIAFQERPISSAKYNAEIDSIYEKLNLLKTNFASSSAPTDFEIGQFWFDLVNNAVKVKTSGGVLSLAYANNESNIRNDAFPVFLTLDGSRSMDSNYTPTSNKHVTTKDYVDNLVNSHTSNTSNPHQTKESQVIDENNPVFLKVDGSRSMDSNYTPTSNKHVTTKDYVDNLVSSHTSNTSNPHQTKESQVVDENNPVFLKVDGSRSMDSNYTPTSNKHVTTKDYVDNLVNSHTSNTSNPHQTKESQVIDENNPIFLTLDGSRSMNSNYVPSSPQDVATKAYVDVQITTGGVGSISSQYVTYTVEDPDILNWDEISNVREALNLVVYRLGSISGDTYQVKINETDTTPGYLVEKVDLNFFDVTSELKLKIKDGLLFKTKLNENDTVGYLVEKVDTNIFEVSPDTTLTIKQNSLNLNHLDLGETTPDKIAFSTSDGKLNFKPFAEMFEFQNDKFSLKQNFLDDTYISVISWNKIDKGGSSINDLQDVSITSPTVENVLKYDGEKWVNSSLDLNNLESVSITSPTSGEVLQYDGEKWINETLKLNMIENVSITSPVSGEVLYHNGEKWINSVLDLNNLESVSITSPISGEVLQYDGEKWKNAPVPFDFVKAAVIASFIV